MDSRRVQVGMKMREGWQGNGMGRVTVVEK